MEGRLQSDPRPSQRPPVRLTVVAAAVFVAALTASVLIGANEVRHDVAQSVARDSKLTPSERRHAAGDRLGFDPAPFDAFRAELRPRDCRAFSCDLFPSYAHCFQLGIPRLAIRPNQHARRFGIAQDLFLISIPAYLAASSQ